MENSDLLTEKINKKIFITGDTSTRDKLKLIGFLNGFSEICDVSFLPPSLKNQINPENYYEIIFGESGDWLEIEYTNIGSVFMWSVIDPFKMREISKKYPDTNFYICSKSLLHNSEVSKEYIEKYKTNLYMNYGSIEGLDIEKFSGIINNSKKLEEGFYEIDHNLFYLYLPCSLASKETDKKNYNKDIDVTYFGTRSNRPGVTHILDSMKDRGYTVVHNEEGSYISPEECIEYYKRSIITIHEQVGPVYLEFPVRFGEASYFGSRIFSLDRMRSLQSYSDGNPNLPSFKSFENPEDLIEEAIRYIKSYNEIPVKDDNKDYTYEFYCEKIIKLTNEKI
jgi:hypothetical protein